LPAVIEVEKVDFASVPTRDLEGARRFYGELLGLPRSAHTPDEFETPNVTLGLRRPEAPKRPRSAVADCAL
jgi:catechol 2,3-dioxygenase-like lactoylglutathione lyase family enzyme